MRIKFLYITVLFLCITISVCAQEKKYQPQKRADRVNSAVQKLSKSLEDNNSDEQVAADYMELAKKLVLEKNYERAENYLQQAISLYSKVKNKELLATAYRELAKVQELQNKFPAAISNYKKASRESKLKEFREINQNDADRLKKRNDPVSQSQYVQRNIDLSNNIRNTAEASNAYQQMAEIRLIQRDTVGAINELNNALSNVEDNIDEAIQIQEKIVNTYVADEQFDKAIEANQNLVKDAKKTNNPVTQANQMVNLSNTYFVANEDDKGLETLQEAYDLAIKNGQTLLAKEIMTEIARQYIKTKKTGKALDVYIDYVSRLDTLVKSDSTLIDEKFFRMHEERIARLENERTLKDELIRQSNLINVILVGLILVILISLIVVAHSLISIHRKNKRIALQSLRREMNPHFIFNSLNSVNRFIAQNNELEANKYLSSYSRLMRNIMENSNKDFIPLSTEIDQVKEYLKLEHIRFHDKFTYEIKIDESLDPDSVLIPNMLIQPQLENSVWHGLRYKDENGLLTLSVDKTANHIRVIIDDNGIGLEESRKLKTEHQRQHKSRGLANTKERISLLNKLYHTNISMEISDKTDEPGVQVTLLFPLTIKSQTTNE